MPAGGTLRAAQEWCPRRPTATGFAALSIAVAFAFVCACVLGVLVDGGVRRSRERITAG